LTDKHCSWTFNEHIEHTDVHLASLLLYLSTALRIVLCWWVTTKYEAIVPGFPMASRPLMCTERIKSSTTVEAIGSNPAVGSSYMTSCSQNQYSKTKVQYTGVCLPLARSLPFQVNQQTEVIQSEWGDWPYHPEFNQPCLRTTPQIFIQNDGHMIMVPPALFALVCHWRW
jgi:hypothetical protein